MSKKVQLNLSPQKAHDPDLVRKIAVTAAGIPSESVRGIRIIKRSVDARKADIKVNLTVEVIYENDSEEYLVEPFNPVNVTGSPEIIIIGAGPAGLFAALRLIELGLRPVILERGKDVSSRKRDIADISKKHLVDPDSNYCFGEGGAGAFSDGKLYTRSKKRGDNRRVLELLYLHGANENILYEAHPHIGTDKLPKIITAIRNSILEADGIIMLQKRVTGLILDGRKIVGVIANGNESFHSHSVILATGHSARDIYELCRNSGIRLEFKSFAMGVRAEHPQELIDRIQYHGKPRGEYLPAASYNLVKQVYGYGVYSFCMCPGGFIVPSATSQEEVVVNGMSPSRRNSPYANSGIVTEIRPSDLSKYARFDELAGLEFQRELEKMAWIQGGRTQTAPAQRLTDFISGRESTSLPSVSYFPGVTSSPLHSWFPDDLASRLREGLRQFGKTMRGFVTHEAVVVGVESRTSSPVRIPRYSTTYEHIEIARLYPCGEGSGYSGGIVSSAVDGICVAEAIACRMK